MSKDGIAIKRRYIFVSGPEGFSLETEQKIKSYFQKLGKKEDENWKPVSDTRKYAEEHPQDWLSLGKKFRSFLTKKFYSTADYAIALIRLAKNSSSPNEEKRTNDSTPLTNEGVKQRFKPEDKFNHVTEL